MTNDEARRLVRATLTELGLDVSEAHGVIEAQRDFAFLRRQRRVSERLGLGLRMAIVTAVVGGALTVLVIAARIALTGRV